jgi:hypothetical protein
MRRIIIIGLLVAIVPWIVIGIVREAGDDDTNDTYYVRAIFDGRAGRGREDRRRPRRRDQ